jgi:hypothetical protein
MSTLKRRLQEAKRKVRRAAQMVEAAGARAAEGSDASRSVNTEVRSNVEMRINIGSDGGAQEASAVQYAPIRQSREPDGARE